MTDDLDIRSGGVAAVDTESLRTAATGFDAVAYELDDASRGARLAAGLLHPLGLAALATARSEELANRTDAAAAHARDSSAGLRTAAAIYEHAELAAEAAAARSAGDAAALARIEDRQASLAEAFPGIASLAARLGRDHEFGWASDFVADALAGGGEGAHPLAVLGGAGLGAVGLTALLAALRALDAGRVPNGARLEGTTGPVAIRPVGMPQHSATAPTSIASAVSRIPDGGSAARVRVETYAMADGSRQHVVYVAGTDAFLGADPWDAQSNLELYAGRASASYEATLEALRASGAEPGDVVHAVGHSQGAMIAARLALEGGFDARSLVVLGSPVAVDLAPSTVVVSIAHADDPVAVLSTGGHASTGGAPGSIAVERTVDPSAGISFAGHRLAEYVETAQAIDASTDPRARALEDLYSELAGATAVTAVEYEATRVATGRWTPVSPSSSGGG